MIVNNDTGNNILFNAHRLPAESKAAKKNKKRRAGKKSSSPAGFDIVEDVSMVMPPIGEPSLPAPVQDPIADLKRQIDEAKASKVQ